MRHCSGGPLMLIRSALPMRRPDAILPQRLLSHNEEGSDEGSSTWPHPGPPALAFRKNIRAAVPKLVLASPPSAISGAAMKGGISLSLGNAAFLSSLAL